MYWRNFVAASFLLFGALLTIITLISGCNKTVIRDAALATYTYDSIFISGYDPPVNGTDPFYYDNYVWVYIFAAHYLSLCAGDVSTDGHELYTTYNECIPKPLGWTLQPSDPFIVNYGVKQGLSPIEPSREEKPQVHTGGPAATLVLGLGFCGLAALAFAVDLLWFRIGMEKISKLSTVLMALAAFFQMVSSALVTNMAIVTRNSNNTPWSEEPHLTSKFLGLSWAAVVSMSLALIWKTWNDVLIKRRSISTTTELTI